jgi:putative ribosome biogenesis GTPase RsgA
MEQLELFSNEQFDVIKPTTKDNDIDTYQQIVLKSNVIQDEYTQYISEAFDLHISDTSKVNIPNKIDLQRLGDWNIGVICGASGSGKSTILNNLAKIGGGYNSTTQIRRNKMSYF